MAQLPISDGESLFYEHVPADDGGKTLVFVNALTGNAGMWQAEICPALHKAGHGTLVYEFRGQPESRTGDETVLSPDLIVDDLVRLLAEIKPKNPVLVGLSIGGLFAAQAHQRGATADAIVFINTLRKPGVRLDWINNAMAAAARTGGLQMIMEMNLPLLLNPETLEEMLPSRTLGPFGPPDPSDGLFRLLANSVETDWDFPYESLDMPVLSMTGLYDRVFLVREDVAALGARIKNHREVVFENAGHMIPMERPQEFTAALLDFVDNL